MNLFLVRGTWEIPIAAKDADSAIMVASGLLSDLRGDATAMGLTKLELSCTKVESMAQVPPDWVSCPLFNDNDLDDLYAEDVLKDREKKKTELLSDLYKCINRAKELGLSYSEIQEVITLQ